MSLPSRGAERNGREPFSGGPPSGRVDETDARILREMLREKVFFWGALDPRVSADDVARRLRLARSTVHARVKAWRRSGLLAASAFTPHPGLLGVGLGGGAIRVQDVRAKEGVLESLALVPGAFSAVDHVGEWVAVCFVRESDAALERLLRLVRRLPGVEEMTPCAPIALQPCGHEMTPLDWRIVRELRRAPERTLAATARALGVSAKTMSRRYEALLEANALWYLPVMDFTRTEGTVVRLILDLEEDADRARVLAALDAWPSLFDVTDAKRLIPQAETVDVALWVPNAGAVEDAMRRALDVPGVRAAEATFPRSWRFFGEWVDERLAARGNA